MRITTQRRSRSPRERSTRPLDNPYLDAFLAPPSEADLSQLRAVFGDHHFVRDSFLLSNIRRDRLTSKYAWAIPTEEAVRRIARLSPICDLGCGTGYWAHLLAQAGAKVVAVDSEPPQDGMNHWHSARIQHFPLVEEDAATYDVPRDHALMLCWPPYSDPMAVTALRRYRGSRVIYVGEGVGGYTADDSFHHAIATRWKLAELIDIPQWPGVHDRVHVYERRRSRRAA